MPPRRSGGVLTLALVVVALIAVGCQVRSSMRRSAHERVGLGLDSVAALKAGLIAEWRDDQVGEASLVASNPWVREWLARAGRGTVPAALEGRARDMVRAFGEHHGFLGISVGPADGSALLSWQAGSAAEPVSSELLQRALRESRGTAAELVAEVGRDRPVLQVAVAERLEGERPSLITLRAGTGHLFEGVIRHWTAPSRTGMTQLSRRDGAGVILAAASGTAPGWTRIPPGTQSNSPGVRAAQGETGVIEAMDADGRQVVAAIRPIAGSEWKVIARMDAVEVEEQLASSFVLVAGLLGALLIASLVLFAVWWRSENARARAEAAIAQSHDLLQLAVAGTHRVWDWDLGAGRMTVTGIGADPAHPRPPRTLRGDIDAILGQLTHPDDVAESRRRLEAVLRGEVESLTLENRTPDGTRWALVRGHASQPGADGRPTRITGVVSDVTERRRVEEQLRRSERLASLGTLAAGMAHEINNPLAYVSANLEFLARRLAELPASGDDQEALAEARGGADRVRDVVQRLRTFSRPGTVGIGSTDLADEIQAAVKMAANEIRHRARLELQLDPTPAVAAEPHLIGEVFLNLLVNAAHAIPEGRAEENVIQVVTRTTPEGWACAEVRDSGSGMSPEVQGHLFEPFYTTKERGKGTGLGMFIAHGIVAAAGGRIEVESSEGRGTCVRTLLPPGKAMARQVGQLGEVVPAGPQGLRILVVDDDQLVGRAIARVLAEHSVVTVGSAAEALSRTRGGERFDALLCDLMMPQMTGAELHALLAEEQPELARRMVFLTGGAFTMAAAEFLRSSRNPCVEKPFDAAALRAAVRVAAASGAPGKGAAGVAEAGASP